MKIINNLSEYMKYIIDNFPEGCAAYNWKSTYSEILNNKRDVKQYEVEHIIDDCLDEFNSVLGICGCGRPEDTEEVIRQILIVQNSEDNFQDKQNKLSNLCDSNIENDNYYGLIQFVLYILDDKEFLEHGSSISGAWLTKKGKIYLDLLNAKYKMTKENE